MKLIRYCQCRGFRLALLLLIAGLTGIGDCAPLTSAQDLAYNADAGTLLVQAQTIGPPRPPPDECYVLPDLRVWGDGRVVRVTFQGDKREIAVGHLSPARIAQLLSFLQGQGALSAWPREMPNPSGSGFSFEVHLQSGVVDNWSNSTPAFFPKLLDLLNADVKPLIPQPAFLIATAGSTTPEQVQEWPERFNISLAQAMDQGLWISGEPLDFLWNDANNGRSLHTFRQNGKMYAVALEIPGVGPREPPEHCWAEWNKLLPRTEEMSIEQARQISGFHLLEPGYLPARFRLLRVIHSTTVAVMQDPANPNLPPVTRYFDSINLEYGSPSFAGQGKSGEFVAIGEKFFPDQSLPPGVPPPAATPDLSPEIVMVRDAPAVVNRHSALSAPSWITPEPGAHDYISIEWHEPDYYFTVAGSMELPELTRIANSLK